MSLLERIIVIFLIVFFVVLAIFNGQNVKFNFIVGSVSMPLILLILSSVIFGFFVGVLSSFAFKKKKNNKN